MATNSDPNAKLLSFEKPIETFLNHNRELGLPQVLDEIFRIMVKTRVINVDIKSQQAFSEHLHSSGPGETFRVKNTEQAVPVFDSSLLVNFDCSIALSSRTMERICENNTELLKNHPEELAKALYNTIFEVTAEDNDFDQISDSLAPGVLMGLGNIEDYEHDQTAVVAKITTFYRRDQEKEVDQTPFETKEDKENALQLIQAYSTKVTANVIVDLRSRLKRALKHYLVDYFTNEQKLRFRDSVAKNDYGESLISKNEIIRQLVSNAARFIREQLVEQW